MPMLLTVFPPAPGLDQLLAAFAARAVESGASGPSL